MGPTGRGRSRAALTLVQQCLRGTALWQNSYDCESRPPRTPACDGGDHLQEYPICLQAQLARQSRASKGRAESVRWVEENGWPRPLGGNRWEPYFRNCYTKCLILGSWPTDPPCDYWNWGKWGYSPR